VFVSLGDTARLSLMRENFFPDGPVPRTATPAARRSRQAR
jgi:hypothetical protein